MITLMLKGDENKSRYWLCTLPEEHYGQIMSTLKKMKVDPESTKFQQPLNQLERCHKAD